MIIPPSEEQVTVNLFCWLLTVLVHMTLKGTEQLKERV